MTKIKLKDGTVLHLDRIHKKFLLNFFYYGRECEKNKFCIRKWSYRGDKYFAFTDDAYHYQYNAKFRIQDLMKKGIVTEEVCTSDIRNYEIYWYCISKRILKEIYHKLKDDEAFNELIEIEEKNHGPGKYEKNLKLLRLKS
jgi:hypothetical protein